MSDDDLGYLYSEPRDDEDEKAMEARFARETATAEEWVDVVVDVVGELEDLLDDGDGYDADDDADESKGGQSFRDAINALERRAKEDRLRHLVDLHARSSYELDQIASNEGDFAVRRALAKQLLDERLALEDK